MRKKEAKDSAGSSGSFASLSTASGAIAMKRLSAICAAAFVAALLFLSVSALAADGEALLQGRIGYVDFSRALNEVGDGKRAKQRLKIEFQEKQQKLDRLQSELKSMKDNLDRDRLIASDESLKKREEAYNRKFMELQQRLDSFRMEMASKENDLTQDILSRLRTIVRDMGKKEGFTLILEKSQDVVLYAPDGGDLTDRVIAAYDKARGLKK